MCRKCDPKDPRPFLEKLEGLNGYYGPTISPCANLKAFTREIQKASQAIVAKGQMYRFDSAFSCSLQGEEHDWFVCHLATTPEDVEPARKILVKRRQADEGANGARLPWAGGAAVPFWAIQKNTGAN
jgi:hypothetical protein